MGKILVKRFGEPDEVVSVPGNVSNVVTLGDTYVAWSVAQPGWRWSKDVKPLVAPPVARSTIREWCSLVRCRFPPKTASNEPLDRAKHSTSSLVTMVGSWGRSPAYSLNFMVFESGENHNSAHDS